LVEISAVRPRVVVFFGSQAFSTGMSMLQGQGFGFRPLGDPLRVRVNKGRELAIRMGHCAGRKELFLGIPQLGQNRYSREGFANMLDAMRHHVRPVVMQYLARAAD
jgi:hypothetical protein